MDISVDASQLDGLAADLLRAIPLAVKDARNAAMDALEVTQNAAQASAPVLTGTLQDSITIDADPDGMGGEVGPTVHYGGFVEYGTSTMSGQPYMGPGHDAGARVLNAGAEDVADGVLS